MKPAHPYFSTKVDMRSRSEMTGFLVNHFTYHTMNSWNLSRSIANNVKVHRLDLPDDIKNVKYDALTDDMYRDIRYVLEEFQTQCNNTYGIGHNGRSSGYLVVYKMSARDTGFVSKCGTCSSFSKKPVPAHMEPLALCPVCGAPSMRNLKFGEAPMRYEFSGSGYEAPEESDLLDPCQFDISTLRDEVRFVQLFDETCDKYVDAFVEWCRDNMTTLTEASA